MGRVMASLALIALVGCGSPSGLEGDWYACTAEDCRFIRSVGLRLEDGDVRYLGVERMGQREVASYCVWEPVAAQYTVNGASIVLPIGDLVGDTLTYRADATTLVISEPREGDFFHHRLDASLFTGACATMPEIVQTAR